MPQRDEHVERAPPRLAHIARVVGHDPWHPRALRHPRERLCQRFLASPRVVQLHLDRKRCLAPSTRERLAPLRQQSLGLAPSPAPEQRAEVPARRPGQQREPGRALRDVLPAYLGMATWRRLGGAPGVVSRPLGEPPRARPRHERGEVLVPLRGPREQRHRPPVDHELDADYRVYAVPPAGEREPHDAAQIARVGQAEMRVAEFGRARGELLGRGRTRAEREGAVRAQFDERRRGAQSHHPCRNHASSGSCACAAARSR